MYKYVFDFPFKLFRNSIIDILMFLEFSDILNFFFQLAALNWPL